MSKKPKRTYDGKLPLVAEDINGERSIEIAKGCRICWSHTLEGDTTRYFIRVVVPGDVPIFEVSDDSWLLYDRRH